MRKGQLSVETVVILGSMILVVAIILVVFSLRVGDVAREKERALSQQFVDRVAAGVDAVFVAGSPSNVSLYFPAKVAGREYALDFADHLIIMHRDGFSVSAPVVAPLNVSVSLPSVKPLGASYVVRMVDGVISLD